VSWVWPLGAGDAAIGSALLALPLDGQPDPGPDALRALPVRCSACQTVMTPALRLATIVVCGRCTAVLAVTAAGRVTVADPADRVQLTPQEWAAIVRAKSAVVAARPQRREW